MRWPKTKSAIAIWRFLIFIFLWAVCALVAVPILGMRPASTKGRPSPSAFVSPTGTPTVFQRRPTLVVTYRPTRTPTLLTPSPTAKTVSSACDDRHPSDNDLLVVVTSQYGLSSGYAPEDLVPLSDDLGPDILSKRDAQIRKVARKPLLEMIRVMRESGLRPLVFSAFRDYASQALTYKKWQSEQGERAAAISAQPGHSEHQLGLAVDFGSPKLPDLVGDPSVEFHVKFALTDEGQWLLNHAHEYGFTLSYPKGSRAVTGFEYEPWHYRYVGVETATYLWENHQFLIQFLLDSRDTPPCDE